MSDGSFRVATKGAVTTITLDRPAVLNAVDPAMQKVQAALDRLAEKSRIAWLRNHRCGERALCAGSDLRAGSHAEGYR